VKLASPGAVLAPSTIEDRIGGLSLEDCGPETLKGFDEPVGVVRITR